MLSQYVREIFYLPEVEILTAEMFVDALVLMIAMFHRFINSCSTKG